MPFYITILVYFLALACAARASVTPTASAAGPAAQPASVSQAADALSDTKVVVLRGDRLDYLQGEDLVVGEGNVYIRQGTVSVFADHLKANLKQRLVEATGNVVWKDGPQAVYADKVTMNLQTKQGHAEGIVYTQGPWLAKGKDVQKTSEKDVLVSEAAFSTCDMENPHYRLTAREIRVVLGESIAADSVVVYAGVVPVFWVPYFSRNLKDPRPPFLIKPGYDSVQGTNVHSTFNYFANENQYGSVELDWMDKLGFGEGLTHHYKIGSGEGDAGGYYTQNKNDPDDRRYTGKFNHQQDLGGGLRAVGNLDLISDSKVNEDFAQSQVDAFQRRSYLTLQSSQADHAWNLQATQIQNLNPLTQNYDISQYTLPALAFNKYSRPLFGLRSVYSSLAASYSRDYQTLSPAAGTWLDTASLAPALSYSLSRLPFRNSLTSNVSYQESLRRQEGEYGFGEGLSSYSTKIDLQTHYRYKLSTDLIHDFGRQLNRIENLPFAGVTQNQFEGRLESDTLASVRILASTNLDIRPYGVDYNIKRLDPLRVQASYNPQAPYNLGTTVNWNVFTRQFKGIDGSVNLLDPGKRWQMGLTSSWVNNGISYYKRPQDDPAAPQFLDFTPPGTRSPDLYLLSTTTSFAVTPVWRLFLYQRLNLVSKQVDEQSFGVWRDLHCWELRASVKQRTDGTFEYGFSLNLKAFPEFKAALPGADLYTSGMGAR